MKKLIFLFMLSLLLVSMAWADTYTENFDTVGNWAGGTASGYNAKTYTNSANPANDGFSTNAAVRETSYTNSSGYAWRMDDLSGAYLRYECEETVNSFSIYLARWDNSPSPNFTIRYSTNSGASYTDIETLTGSWFTGDKVYKQYSHLFSTPISASAGSKVYIEVYTNSGERMLADDFVLEYGSSAPTPYLSLTPTSLTNFSYEYGNGPSTAQSFAVTGSNLTGDLSVSSTGTDYVVSATESGTYGSSLTLTQSGGAVSATVYVKLNSGLAIGDYTSQNITVSGGGATSQSVTCSGTVSSPPPPSAPTAEAATAIDDDAFTANWSSASGATGYKLDVYKMEAGSNASDLFISEYIEGSSNNKAIEIYNGTGTSVSLSNYNLKVYANGSTSPGSAISLSGTLADGATYIVANSSANSTITALADMTSGSLTPNGNDAVGLFYDNTMIDVVGNVGSSSYWGEDVTLVRKADSSVPKLAYDASDWDSYSCDTTSYLGSHTFTGGMATTYLSGYTELDVSNVTSYLVSDLDPLTTYYYVVRAYNTYGESENSNEISATTTASMPMITLNPESLSGFVYQEGSGPSAEQSFTVIATNLSADLSLDAPANYEISGVSGASFSAQDPLTLSPVSGEIAETTIYVRLKAGLSANDYNDELITATSTGATQKTVTLSGTVSPPPPPVLTLSNDTLNGFTYLEGEGPSDEQSFTIIGADLTANINIAATTNFEISTDTGAAFVATNPITLTPVEGAVAETTIYVRLKAGLAIGLYQNESIAITSSGADAKSVNCSGSVIDPSLALETFDSFPESGTSYNTGTFTGVDGSTWNYVKCAGSQQITGKSVTLGKNQDPLAEVYSGTIHGGIGSLSFDYMQAFSTDVSLDVYVNETLVTTVSSSSQQSVVLNSGAIVVNQPGDVVIRFYNPTGGQVVIDNITWNSIYDIPEDMVVTIGGADFYLLGGSANINAAGEVPGFTHPTMVPSLSIVLTLIGAGPWDFLIETDALYGAYHRGGTWTAVENVGGLIEFNVAAAKDMNLPIILGDSDPNTLPVELSSFTAVISSAHQAKLTWVTQSETSVNGFYIYRSLENDADSAIQLSGLIPATNTSMQQVYQFTDSELNQIGTYYYWLIVADMDGSESFYGPVNVVYDYDDNFSPEIPQKTELSKLYPNPFNPSTTISFALAEDQLVDVNIYNNRGQRVRSFALGQKSAGNHTLIWDGRDDNGKAVTTGIYFIRMSAGGESFHKKAVLMK